ncbi:glycosyltransferase family 4 protein [Massilia rubra]|uniref:Glycosyltransferase family 4 protein n=1 Tax=Massilia rubra TaxID=2607910 RepID=A0ABX0LMH8_9BURK|nr:glycosyltransferase family 4 protein [Massilia rubra]NHZ34000.1 glycosyltransferase family 4 protein [Massilia rubra]
MNILLINHYAGSLKHGMEYRPFYLAREWVRLGHTVRIIASSQSHIRAQAPQLHGCDQLDETIDGVGYRWVATPAYRGNGGARVANMLAFVTRLHLQARRLAAEFAPDVVIASSTYPLDIWPAHRIARCAGARLLFELHDLWPLSPIELGGYSRRHPFIMLLQAAENYACRNACAIVSILPKVRDHLEAHGMAPHKLHIVPNGADPAEWLAAPPALDGIAGARLAALRSDGKFIVGYAGTHGLANALDTLLDAARLVADQRIAFVLAGGGPDKARLVRLAMERGLHNVHFLDPVPKQQVPALLAHFDVAYIGWQRQRLYRYGIAPNKLIDYMMAGRPILHSVEAGNDPVAEAGCGLTVAPQDPVAVAHGLLALFTLDQQERDAAGERGRAYAMAKLSYPVLARRFLQACA